MSTVSLQCAVLNL